MSAYTFGPPVFLDGPLPEAPLHSLLSAPGVRQDPGDDRWMNGGALWGYPEGVPLLWDPCGTGTYETKSDDQSFSTPDFAAFVAYLPITCSSFTVASDPEGFARRAEKALDATISYALESALSQGLPLVANPFLADAAADVLAGGASVTPEVGMAYLENAIGETGRRGMLHMTPAVASSFFDNWGVLVEDLYTPLGTPVAVGGGYIGANPSGEAPAAAGQSWVYATGPVKAWVQDEMTLNIKDVLDRSDNVVTFRAEKYVLVVWDTALQAAVLVDWTP